MKTELIFGNSRLNFAARAPRRWLVALIYLVLVLLVAAWSVGFMAKAHSYLFIGIVFIVFKFFGTQSTPGALLGIVGSGDERERQRWDRAHTRAYHYMSWMLIAGLIMAYLLSPSPVAQLIMPSSKTVADNITAAMLMGGIIVYATLPQAIFLWNEPDVEEPR